MRTVHIDRLPLTTTDHMRIAASLAALALAAKSDAVGAYIRELSNKHALMAELGSAFEVQA